MLDTVSVLKKVPLLFGVISTFGEVVQLTTAKKRDFTQKFISFQVQLLEFT